MYLVVTQHRFRNWILSGVWKDSAKAVGINPLVVHLHERNWIKRIDKLRIKTLGLFAKRIVFIHHTSFLETIPQLKNHFGRSYSIYVTHISERDIEKLSNYRDLDVKFCVMNSLNRKRFLEKGIPKEKILLIFGAVDRSIFYPSLTAPSARFVLISGDCKERKNPELVFEVIKCMPELQFVCEGPGWSEFMTPERLPHNVRFERIDFQKKGEIMRNATLLLNLSKEEGGPYPVLEALACGTPVLSTDVGFVSDVLPREFGQIIGQETPIDELKKAILSAIELKSLCYSDDLLFGRYTWLEHGAKLFRIGDKGMEGASEFSDKG